MTSEVSCKFPKGGWGVAGAGGEGGTSPERQVLSLLVVRESNAKTDGIVIQMKDIVAKLS